MSEYSLETQYHGPEFSFYSGVRCLGRKENPSDHSRGIDFPIEINMYSQCWSVGGRLRIL